MKLNNLLLLLFPLLAQAMDHADIVKEMNSTLTSKSVMGINKNAHEVPLNLLFDNETKKRINKTKLIQPSPSPSPHASFEFIKSANAFGSKPAPEVTSIDLRARDCHVLNQWNGTCTAHGLSAAIENVMSCSVKLSERHLWSRYKTYSVYPAIDAAKLGITSNKVWPHEYEGPVDNASNVVKLANVADLGGNVDLAIKTLKNKHPVYVAMNTPIDLLTCNAVVRESTLASKTGGHAMSIVGYKKDATIKSGGYFILKNSWGSNCGDRGYQYLPFSYCSRSDTYCLFFEVSEVTKF